MKLFLKEYSTAVSILFSLYIVTALNIDLASPSNLSLFKTHNLELVLLFFFNYRFLQKCISLVNTKTIMSLKDWLLYISPAVLFSAFMIIGFSFQIKGDASCIISSKYQLLKALFVAGGYFVLFLCIIVLLFEKLDKFSPFSAETVFQGSWGYIFYKHPFITSFLILFICSIPYIVLSYPAIFLKWDTPDQILHGYNLQSFSLYLHLPLISEKVQIINHHPVVHTLLLHYFIVLGNLVRNYNFGVFLFAFVQLIFFITAISFLIVLLIRRFHLKVKYVLVVLAYYLFHPFVQNYMMMLAKDVPYTIFLLFFLLLSYLFLEKESFSFKQNVIWFITMIGVVLFRNEGIYLVVPTLFFLLFLNVSKKQVLSVMCSIVCFFLVWHNMVLPFFKITPGSVREMLSIPFQQTARYVKFQPQKVTQSEKKAIDAVLDYEILGKLYDPSLSDLVKNSFKYNSTTEQRFTYLKTWARMFFKEPKLYIEATIANKYEFFYPESNLGWFNLYVWSEEAMKQVNDNADRKGISFGFHHQKKLRKYRERYEQVRETITRQPVFNILRSASTYLWILLLFVFYSIRLRNKKAIALLVPFIMHLLVLIACPCNGSYFRYVYPYAVTFPFLFIFLMHLKDTDCSSSVHQSKEEY